MDAISLVVVGAAGRMGRAVAAMALEDERFGAVVGVDRVSVPDGVGRAVSVTTDLGQALAGNPDAVVVDVSSPEKALERIQIVVSAGAPLVQGTTALGSDAAEALRAGAKRVPIVVAPNFSPGIALLRHALKAVLGARGPEWDAGIMDRHHRAKKDAPSGTARLLESWIRENTDSASKISPEVSSFRQGNVVGEHTVFLSGNEEELVLTHRAFGREVFGRGALLAAIFARGAVPGSYTIDDVLGLGAGG